MPAFKDLRSQKFGRLIPVYPTRKRDKWGNVIWKCICDCGNLIEVVSGNLVSGKTHSCGCIQKEVHPSFKHGDAFTGKEKRIYYIWKRMKQRCSNSNASDYKYYGGKGISVCESWSKNYLIFKTWAMANGYSNVLVIDRINHKGNYEPSNCQWITQSENLRKSWKERER